MASTLPRRPVSALALLALSLVLPAGLSSQDAPEGALPKQKENPPRPAEEAQLVTLDFPGGTLSAYVDHLREMFDVNAVAAPDTRDLPMPPLSLKKVSVGTAMNLIEAMSRSLSGDPGAVSVNTLSDPEGNPVFIVELKGSGQAGPAGAMAPPGVMMSGGPRTIPPRPNRMLGGNPALAGPSLQPVRTLQVFSIKILTQPISGRNDLAMPPENVLTAIDTALALSPGDEPAQVKYHPETGLIFVHGTPGQLEAVGTLIRTLNEDQTVLRKSGPPEDFQKLVDKLREENETLRAQVTELLQQLKYITERVNQSPSGGFRPPESKRSEPSKN